MKTLRGAINNFSTYTSLLRELVIRDIKVKYRGSILGLIWSVLNPLLIMVVMTIVFTTIFPTEIPHFPVYYLSGSLVFTLNSEATTDAMNSIISNAALLKKVYVPKYMFPLSKVVTAMVNAGFSTVAMLLIMLITGAPFHLTLFLFPVILVYTAIFSTGLGIFLAAVAVRFRDVCYLYSVFVYAWTFLTPIFYPADRLTGVAAVIMNLNPMYHFVNYSRNVVLYGVVPSPLLNLSCLGLGLLAMLVGVFTFGKMQNSFIYHI